MTRNEKILQLHETRLSYGEIVEVLGRNGIDITRNVVAGVIWRKRWPYSLRINSPNSKGPNKCGTGRPRAQEAPAHG